eukprot:10042872-Ditylum_brightwellii.AAC.1
MISRSELFVSANATGTKEDEECVDGCFDGCVCLVDGSKEDGVNDSVDNGGDKHLIHLTQVVSCHLNTRRDANSAGAKVDEECVNSCYDVCVNDCFDGSVGHVDDGKEDGVNDSVDCGVKHLIHLAQEFSCNLNAKSAQNVCVDGSKEDGADDSVDGGEKYLIHVTQE